PRPCALLRISRRSRRPIRFLRSTAVVPMHGWRNENAEGRDCVPRSVVNSVDILVTMRNIQKVSFVDSIFVPFRCLALLAMSVLDDFLRIRLYRKQAAEFQWLADNASIASVQRRYRAIARHYSELADREERADKARMAERLRQLRLKREEAAARVRQSGEAYDNLAIGLLRLMQIRARRRRFVQRRWCSLQNQVRRSR